jgi:hypothetical protein
MPSPGVVGNPNWKKGVSGNPNGRPRKHGDSRKTLERLHEGLWALAEFVAQTTEGEDSRNSVQILLDFARNEKTPTHLRIAAAAAAAPYEFIKKQDVYVKVPIDVPDFHSLEQAEDFLLNLAKQVAAGELDFKSTEIVADRVQRWINSKRYGMEIEIKRLNTDSGAGDQRIVITGGLPTMPGLEGVLMPQLNGHTIDSVAIESTPTDSLPHDTTPKDPGP